MEFLFVSDYYFIIFNQMISFYQNLLSTGISTALFVMLIGAVLIYEINKVAATTKVKAYRVAALAGRWVLIIVTVLVVMEELGVGNNTVQIFASGFSLMIALAGGLAFGLGGQYQAKEILDEFKHKIVQK